MLTFSYTVAMFLSISRCRNRIDTMFNEEFFKLTRSEQNKECGKCHQEIYEQELNGPHAHAYYSIQEHVQYVSQPKYECSFYENHVLKNSETECMRCHAPDNMFQSVFQHHHATDSLLGWLMQKDYPHQPIPWKKTDKDKTTGVDCLSCHFDGQGVMSSNKKYTSTFYSAPCNPKYSELFAKTDITCLPCHTDAAKSAYKFYGSNYNFRRCNTCHTLTNQKQPHRYIWYKDPPALTHHLYNGIFKNMIATYDVSHATLRLTSSFEMPHVTAQCTELLLQCTALANDSTAITSYLIRFNRKAEFDSLMYDYYNKNKLGGVEGGAFFQPGKAFNHSEKIKPTNKKTPAILKLELFKKQQYWLHDSLMYPLYTTHIPISH
ncbi:MAG: cytochrome c family protein [Chitinophagales bacterium]|nr:cytochrome c family protein [Chitinophagales bacterium]MDW8417783.1 multiheme c-type cytochrome [Chitinophagales bacterium]